MGTKLSGYALKRGQANLPVSSAHGRVLETRQAIVAAARDVLIEKGYNATRIEDIVARAEISRPTFYRYFEDKFEVAKAYHAQSRSNFIHPWRALGARDFRGLESVAAWLDQLFDAYASNREELVVWAEMSSVEPGYLLRMPRQMPELIEKLAETIPAFARAQTESPGASSFKREAGRVWVEAYLLLEHLSYTCTWMALGKQQITRQQSVEYFAEQVSRFIERYDDIGTR